MSVYVLAGLFLGQDTLRYTGRDHLLRLDICAVASGLLALGLIVLPRRCIRACVVVFNVATLAVIAAGVAAVWDAPRKNHPLRLRFSETAEPPGEVVPGNRGNVGPWYSHNRYIGATTYVWREQFGGEWLPALSLAAWSGFLYWEEAKPGVPVPPRVGVLSPSSSNSDYVPKVFRWKSSMPASMVPECRKY
ncbi:MAG TPA: hypothetical protein EYP62_07215 [Kiritimatiellae bacterium]|nr:hypothetical protein [Kiritimatiellia bacterium]